MSAKRVRVRKYQKEHEKKKRAKHHAYDQMRISENELEAQFQLTKLLIATEYMEPNKEVLGDFLK